MHAAIALLVAIAGLVFWMGRAAQGARHVADAANDLKNMPRRRRFQKTASRQGLDLIDNPVDAATVMMLCVARLDGAKELSKADKRAIYLQMTEHFGLEPEDANDTMTQLNWMVSDFMQPGTAFFPMVKILQKSLSRTEAATLAGMLQTVANVGGDPNAEQNEFIRRYRARMGIDA